MSSGPPQPHASSALRGGLPFSQHPLYSGTAPPPQARPNLSTYSQYTRPTGTDAPPSRTTAPPPRVTGADALPSPSRYDFNAIPTSAAGPPAVPPPPLALGGLPPPPPPGAASHRQAPPSVASTQGDAALARRRTNSPLSTRASGSGLGAAGSRPRTLRAQSGDDTATAAAEPIKGAVAGERERLVAARLSSRLQSPAAPGLTAASGVNSPYMADALQQLRPLTEARGGSGSRAREQFSQLLKRDVPSFLKPDGGGSSGANATVGSGVAGGLALRRPVSTAAAATGRPAAAVSRGEGLLQAALRRRGSGAGSSTASLPSASNLLSVPATATATPRQKEEERGGRQHLPQQQQPQGDLLTPQPHRLHAVAVTHHVTPPPPPPAPAPQPTAGEAAKAASYRSNVVNVLPVSSGGPLGADIADAARPLSGGHRGELGDASSLGTMSPTSFRFSPISTVLSYAHESGEHSNPNLLAGEVDVSAIDTSALLRRRSLCSGATAPKLHPNESPSGSVPSGQANFLTAASAGPLTSAGEEVSSESACANPFNTPKPTAAVGHERGQLFMEDPQSTHSAAHAAVSNPFAAESGHPSGATELGHGGSALWSADAKVAAAPGPAQATPPARKIITQLHLHDLHQRAGYSKQPAQGGHVSYPERMPIAHHTPGVVEDVNTKLTPRVFASSGHYAASPFVRDETAADGESPAPSRPYMQSVNSTMEGEEREEDEALGDSVRGIERMATVAVPPMQRLGLQSQLVTSPEATDADGLGQQPQLLQTEQCTGAEGGGEPFSGGGAFNSGETFLDAAAFQVTAEEPQTSVLEASSTDTAPNPFADPHGPGTPHPASTSVGSKVPAVVAFPPLQSHPPAPSPHFAAAATEESGKSATPLVNPFAKPTSVSTSDVSAAVPLRRRRPRAPCFALFHPSGGGVVACFNQPNTGTMALGTSSKRACSHIVSCTPLRALTASEEAGGCVRGTSAGSSYAALLRSVATAGLAFPVTPDSASASRGVDVSPIASADVMAGVMTGLSPALPSPMPEVLQLVLADAVHHGVEGKGLVWGKGGKRHLAELLTNNPSGMSCSPLQGDRDNGSVCASASAGLCEVQDLVSRGEREAAVEAALRHRLFTHAILIAMMCEKKDSYIASVRAVIEQELLPTSPLSHAYCLFNEMALPPYAAAPASPLPAAEQLGGGGMAPGAATEKDHTSLTRSWRLHAATLISNFTRRSGEGLLRLGDDLQRAGLVMEAHTCFLLAHLSPLGTLFSPGTTPRPEQLAMAEELRIRLGVLGGHYHPLDSCRAAFLTPASTLLTDLLQETRVLLVAGGHSNGIPVRPPRYACAFRFMQVLWLREAGMAAEAQALLDALLRGALATPEATRGAPRTLNELIYVLGHVPFTPPAASTAAGDVPPPANTVPPAPAPAAGSRARLVGDDGPSTQAPPPPPPSSKQMPPGPEIRRGITSGMMAPSRVPPPPPQQQQQQGVQRLPPLPLPSTGTASSPLPPEQPLPELPPNSTDGGDGRPSGEALAGAAPPEQRKIQPPPNSRQRGGRSVTPPPKDHPGKPSEKPKRSRSVEAFMSFFRRGKSEDTAASGSAKKDEEAKPMILDTTAPPKFDAAAGRWLFEESEEEKARAAMVKQGPPKMPLPAAAGGPAKGPPTAGRLMKGPPAAGAGVGRRPGGNMGKPQYVDMFNS